MSKSSTDPQLPVDRTDRSISLPELVTRIAYELGALAQLSMRVQSALSEIDLKDHCPPDSVRDLQAIDRITQMLEDFTALTGAISTVIPKTTVPNPSELFASLTLTELVQNLDPRTAAKSEKAKEDGEVLWF